MVAKLLFDDITYPDELMVRFQGKDKLLRAFRNEIRVPIDHIESIDVIDPRIIQDAHGLVEVAGVGAGSLGKSMERSIGKEKKALKGKAISIALKLRKERNKELSFEVNDVESEKVIKVMQEMLHEASFNL